MSKAENWERLARGLSNKFKQLRIGDKDAITPDRFAHKALEYMEFIHIEDGLRDEFLRRAHYREDLLKDKEVEKKLDNLRRLCEAATQTIAANAPPGMMDSTDPKTGRGIPRAFLEGTKRLIQTLAKDPAIRFEEGYSKELTDVAEREGRPVTWADAISHMRIAAGMASARSRAVDDAIEKAEQAAQELDRLFGAEWRAHGRRAMKELSEVYNAWKECIPGCYDRAEVESLIEDVHLALLDWIEDQKQCTGESGAKGGGRKRRNRQPLSREPRPLTERQVEAVQIVGECKGSIAEAGRRLGRDRKTIKQHYEAAHKKLGAKAMKLFLKTQRLPTDKRGQVNV